MLAVVEPHRLRRHGQITGKDLAQARASHDEPVSVSRAGEARCAGELVAGKKGDEQRQFGMGGAKPPRPYVDRVLQGFGWHRLLRWSGLGHLGARWKRSAASSGLSRCYARARPSEGVAIYEAHERCCRYDLQVKPQRPVLNVIEIHLDTPAHLFGILGWSTQSMDLRPSREARLDTMPAGVAIEALVIVVVVLQCVRAWPHQGHLPTHNIDELGQLVQARSPQKLSPARP